MKTLFSFNFSSSNSYRDSRHFPRVVVLCPSDFESEVRTSLRISFVSADWRTPVDIQLNRDEVYSRGFSEVGKFPMNDGRLEIWMVESMEVEKR